MKKQELANQIYAAMQYSAAAWYVHDDTSLALWRAKFIELTSGMTKKHACKLADKADLSFRMIIDQECEEIIAGERKAP